MPRVWADGMSWPKKLDEGDEEIVQGITTQSYTMAGTMASAKRLVANQFSVSDDKALEMIDAWITEAPHILCSRCDRVLRIKQRSKGRGRQPGPITVECPECDGKDEGALFEADTLEAKTVRFVAPGRMAYVTLLTFDRARICYGDFRGIIDCWEYGHWIDAVVAFNQWDGDPLIQPEGWAYRRLEGRRRERAGQEDMA